MARRPACGDEGGFVYFAFPDGIDFEFDGIDTKENSQCVAPGAGFTYADDLTAKNGIVVFNLFGRWVIDFTQTGVNSLLVSEKSDDGD